MSSEKLILEELSLVSTGDPSLVHDIVATGFADALQDNVTFSPSVFSAPRGWAVIAGLSVTIKQSI